MAGAAVAAAVAKTRRRIVHNFETAGATSAAHAVAFQPGSGRLEARMFRRMLDFGAVVAAGDGRYWLNERRLADFRKESLAKVLGVLALAGLAAAGAIALGG